MSDNYLTRKVKDKRTLARI